ncbi:MAG: H(+)/Cl(-) exchange transporter ClcA [Magnetococcales bacterium]|nr:H(+)/Cl(-) exchange transporter ClcA [Magnetococcales bacterium]
MADKFLNRLPTIHLNSTAVVIILAKQDQSDRVQRMDINNDRVEIRKQYGSIKRRKILLKSLIIGIFSGLMAVEFRLSLEYSESIRNLFLQYAVSDDSTFPWISSVLFGILIPAIIYLTGKIEPDSGGSGIPHLKGYLEGFNRFRGWRILLVKFVGGVVGIGSGLALGREGPTVQMGAAIGKIFGDYLTTNQTELKILISSGAGAGLAAAFNAPLAGVFFILEELHKSFNQTILVASFVSCIAADLICHLIIGDVPVFHVKILNYPGTDSLPIVLIFGVFISLLGMLFSKVLLISSFYVQNFSLAARMIFGLLVGVVLGGTGLIFPECLGMGTRLLSGILDNQYETGMVALYFIFRFILTVTSYSTGAPGGIFFPMLLLGVLSGSFFGHYFHFAFPEIFDQSVWVALGMAGFFASVVRAPITGTILILEMTSTYELLLPLMIVSIVAYSIPEYFSSKPIYDALLQRDLVRRSLKA